MNKDLLIGFDYGKSAVLKRIEGEEDFEIVEMEWGFLPDYIRNREQAEKFRTGYKKENGDWKLGNNLSYIAGIWQPWKDF